MIVFLLALVSATTIRSAKRSTNASIATTAARPDLAGFLAGIKAAAVGGNVVVAPIGPATTSPVPTTCALNQPQACSCAGIPGSCGQTASLSGVAGIVIGVSTGTVCIVGDVLSGNFAACASFTTPDGPGALCADLDDNSQFCFAGTEYGIDIEDDVPNNCFGLSTAHADEYECVTEMTCYAGLTAASACTEGNMCVQGFCCGGPNGPGCLDGFACTSGDQCESGACDAFTHKCCGIDGPCSDGTICPTSGVCGSSNCAGICCTSDSCGTDNGECCNGVTCTSAGDCAGRGCTSATAGACCGVGSPCPDFSQCTGPEACSSGGCDLTGTGDPLGDDDDHIGVCCTAGKCGDGVSCTNTNACASGGCRVLALPASGNLIEYGEDFEEFDNGVIPYGCCGDDIPCLDGALCTSNTVCLTGICDSTGTCCGNTQACSDGISCSAPNACLFGGCSTSNTCCGGADSLCEAGSSCLLDSACANGPCVNGVCVSALAGTAGTAGQNGAAGADGAAGTAGADGAAGTAGADGAAGTAGADGAPGAAGTAGTPGANGSPGAAGPPGSPAVLPAGVSTACAAALSTSAGGASLTINNDGSCVIASGNNIAKRAVAATAQGARVRISISLAYRRAESSDDSQSIETMQCGPHVHLSINGVVVLKNSEILFANSGSISAAVDLPLQFGTYQLAERIEVSHCKGHHIDLTETAIEVMIVQALATVPAGINLPHVLD